MDKIYEIIFELKASMNSLFFIIFYMSRIQVKNCELENEIQMQGLIQDGLNFNDSKLGSFLGEDFPTMAAITNTTLIRGKGRPKGEKNSKEREKKTKNILNDQNRRRGHWSMDQNKRYHWFLEIYNKHFICKEMRRMDKIFKTMAVFIGTREAQQCRSHHQKMEKKYHSFTNIILYLRKFHYGTEDGKMVEQDIASNQINDSTSLALMHPKELQDLQMIKQVPPTPSLPQQSKIDFGFDEPHKQFQFQQNFLDLLGEDYEHRFQLDNLLL